MSTFYKEFNAEQLKEDVKRMEDTRNSKPTLLPNETLVASAQRPKSDKKEPAPATPPVATTGKKPSLRDLMRQTVQDKNVQEVRADMDQAQEFDAQTILDYVQMRWEMNGLPGLPEGFPTWSWEDQIKVLSPLAKKNVGIRTMIGTVEALHGNDFLRSTLNDVMAEFGLPLQEIGNLQELKEFLEQAVRNDIVECVENPKYEQSDGVAILTDLSDSTNQDVSVYLPKKGSKVAKDAWKVMQVKYRDLSEGWEAFEELRAKATPRFTPFKASDKRDGSGGLTGDLYVMSRTGSWAILLGISHSSRGQTVACIKKSVGIGENQMPSPNEIEWDHRGHCLRNPERNDFWLAINQALEDLNSRQHKKVLADREKSDRAFESLKEAATLPSEPKEQGLHRIILNQEEGTITICLANFSIKKRNGRVKSGHFGIAVKCVSDMLVLVQAEASECFCFQQGLVGKKLMFKIDFQKNNVEMDIGAFCHENGIRGRLDGSYFESLKMIAALLRRRLNREDALAPDDYVQGEEEELEVQEEELETVQKPD